MRFKVFFFLLSLQGALFSSQIYNAKYEGPEFLVLVTGCTRSGTRFIAELCRNNGLLIEHERLGRDGQYATFYNQLRQLAAKYGYIDFNENEE